MVRIRLRRTGKTKQPSYRVVVADSESPRDGRFIENIGIYNPRRDPPVIEIQEDRALYWLSQGAQPTESMERLLRKVGIMQKFRGEAPPAAAKEETAPEEQAPAPEASAEEAEVPEEAATSEAPAEEVETAAEEETETPAAEETDTATTEEDTTDEA
jgi:small subunit ribosomal protein S16